LILAREEKITQGMNNRLAEIGRYNAKRRFVDKKKIWRL
jgi:hypothetical protein